LKIKFCSYREKKVLVLYKKKEWNLIAITGGGTGGHIFPNISIIGELKKRGYTNIFWIGEKRGKEKAWSERIHVPFYGIKTGKLRRYFSFKNFIDVFFVLIGVIQSFFLFLKMKPELLFSKGGFVAVPPVLAAWLLRIPVITHESDITPGLATRIISRFASVICVSFEKTTKHYSKKRVVFTGNPVRDIFKRGDRKSGLSFLKFKQELPIVLVIGGSLGASSINRAVWQMNRKYDPPFNLVHQCGAGNFRRDIPLKGKYRQFEFISEEIGDVLAASDIVVSRAGAGALYESGYLKKPSILIPLPKSKSRGEQIENARYFAENGASVVIYDEDLNEDVLFKTINRLLADRVNLKMIGERAETLCKTDAEKSICDIIESLAIKK